MSEQVNISGKRSVSGRWPSGLHYHPLPIHGPAAGPRFGRLVRLSLPAALLTFVFCGLAFAESQAPAGRVDDVKGTAIAELASDKRDLGSQADVYVGDNVSTGDKSHLEMHLGRDTKVRLGEKTRLKIDRFLVNSGGEITLGDGSLLIDKAPESSARPVQVRSAFGLITVRGTIVFAGPSQGVFGILVTRGEVVVAAAGRRVRLRSGQGTSIASPGDPPTPARRWDAQRVREALASVD
jgi:FecR protein